LIIGNADVSVSVEAELTAEATDSTLFDASVCRARIRQGLQPLLIKVGIASRSVSRRHHQDDPPASKNQKGFAIAWPLSFVHFWMWLFC
jgi:hypothetical protein